MKAGVSTASFYPMQLEEAVMCLNAHEIKNIEIFINTYSELSLNYLSELSRKIKDNGQRVISIHPFTSGFEPFMLFTGYERRFQDGLELHRHYFNAMNQLGAEVFVFHGDRKLGKLSEKEYFERFAKLRDLGKEYGVIVAQENVSRCKSHSLRFLKNMIEYLDGDVSLVFDNKQAIRSGVTYEEYINTLGKNIVHMHISDNSELCDCMALGEGTLNIVKLLDLVKTFCFNGSVIVELYLDLIDGIDKIYDSYKYLSSIIHNDT